MKRLAPVGMFLALATVFVLFSCEGDAGPTGPEGPRGPAGPSTILAFGAVDNAQNVLSISPSDVAISVGTSGTGRYQVTLTFPDSVDATVWPTLLVTANIISNTTARADGDLDCYFGTATGSSCTPNEVDFEVFMTSTATGSTLDEGFSFVLLQ